MKAIEQFKSNRNFIKNPEGKEINQKCMISYILNRILLGKKQWDITFKGKAIYSKTQMAVKWLEYYKRLVLSYIEYFINKVLGKKNCTWSPTKPINVISCSNNPNENLLEYILGTVGLTIADEHFYANKTVYTVKLK